MFDGQELIWHSETSGHISMILIQVTSLGHHPPRCQAEPGTEAPAKKAKLSRPLGQPETN